MPPYGKMVIVKHYMSNRLLVLVTYSSESKVSTSTVTKTEHTMIAFALLSHCHARFRLRLTHMASESRDTVRDHLETALHHHQLGFQAGRRKDCEATAAAVSAGDK